MQLLRREATFGHKSRKEIRKKEQAEKISFPLLPIAALYSRKDRLFAKEAFLKLTKFFAKKGKHSDVCWLVFYQIAEATRQVSLQARELLLATILEAVLRTITNKPFRQGGKSLDLRQRMDSFRKSFLTADWTAACDQAIKSQKNLRDRNAHPDWLTSEDERLSKERMRPTITDMMFLSRFYGYMILALAGFRDLQPQFPKPSFEDTAGSG